MRARLGVLRREDGQVLPLTVGIFVVILIAAGVVLDFGRAYVMKRQLQATADAAALAAAGSLPDANAATAMAASYGVAGSNKVVGANPQTVVPWCLKSLTYCFGNSPGAAPTNGQSNGLLIKESASVPTDFLKLIGIDSIKVGAMATACGLCATQPLDIALVVDRTNSMVGDMEQLRQGIQTFLAGLDDNLDYVSLLVLPPIVGGNVCNAAGAGAYPFDDGDSYPVGTDSRSSYVAVHLSSDYQSKPGVLNPSSQIVQDVTGSCLKAGGSTSFKQALVAAEDELVNHGSGRKNVQRVVVFESDGAANIQPDSYYNSSSGVDWNTNRGAPTIYTPASGHEDDILRPCGSAIDYSRNTIQAQGIFVYTVFYSVNTDVDDASQRDCFQSPHRTFVYGGKTRPKAGYATDPNYPPIDEGITGQQALHDMASTPGDAFTADQTNALVSQFATIATKLDGQKLVPDTEAAGAG